MGISCHGNLAMKGAELLPWKGSWGVETSLALGGEREEEGELDL